MNIKTHNTLKLGWTDRHGWIDEQMDGQTQTHRWTYTCEAGYMDERTTE